ncbi:unnamed protein product [Miscanthus lutarioriparius]|uniref:Uncharacterized protein n=1 Tax=Miscanthus lutarioriparius TaxID=422564 RepID=A0A811SCC2_9POAL|nr:unnamed protein product [Miscanthus lutarioriparius]
MVLRLHLHLPRELKPSHQRSQPSPLTKLQQPPAVAFDASLQPPPPVAVAALRQVAVAGDTATSQVPTHHSEEETGREPESALSDLAGRKTLRREDSGRRQGEMKSLGEGGWREAPGRRSAQWSSSRWGDLGDGSGRSAERAGGGGGGDGTDLGFGGEIEPGFLGWAKVTS